MGDSYNSMQDALATLQEAINNALHGSEWYPAYSEQMKQFAELGKKAAVAQANIPATIGPMIQALQAMQDQIKSSLSAQQLSMVCSDYLANKTVDVAIAAAPYMTEEQFEQVQSVLPVKEEKKKLDLKTTISLVVAVINLLSGLVSCSNQMVTKQPQVINIITISPDTPQETIEQYLSNMLDGYKIILDNGAEDSTDKVLDNGGDT